MNMNIKWRFPWIVMMGWIVAWTPAAVAVMQGQSEITYGIEYSDKAEKNAKFREYNYKRDDKPGIRIDLHKELDLTSSESAGAHRWLDRVGLAKSGADYLNVDVSGRSPEDVRFDMITGSYGRSKLTLAVQRMGHNFSFDARSLYSGNGSGTLSMSDAIQTDIQNTAAATRDDKLRTYLATSGSDIDLALHRDKVRLNFERLADERPVTWNLFIDQEFRKGSRPYGGSFGHGNAVEIPEPIDYGTLNLGGGAEYVAKDLYATATLTHSRFRNDISSVMFDNPLIVSDSTAGAAAGRNALPPDNTYDNLTLFASKAVEDKFHTRASARVSFARMRQNENLLAMTSNTAYDTAAPSFTNLGTTKAGLKVDKRQYVADLSSSLTDKFRVKTSFHYDQHKNGSPVFTTPIFLAYDGSVAKSGETTTYVSYIKRVTEAEAEYEISKDKDVAFTFEHEVASFKNGSANHERENVYELMLNRHTDLTTSRLVLKHADKTSDYPNYPRYAVELPLMRKYYAASRAQNQITAMITTSPTDKLTLSGEFLYGRDKYPRSTYGLQKKKYNLIGLDADYRIDDRTSIQAFYSFEYDKSLQRSHQWAANSPMDPHAYPDTYNQSGSWTLARRDKWRTFGATISSVIVENVFDITLTGSMSRVDGLADYDSQGATVPPSDFQQIDESRLATVDARMNYRMKNKPGVVAFGYRYDKWRVYDFQYDGVQEVAENSTGSYLGLLNMNTLSKPYGGIHTVYLNFNYPF